MSKKRKGSILTQIQEIHWILIKVVQGYKNEQVKYKNKTRALFLPPRPSENLFEHYSPSCTYASKVCFVIKGFIRIDLQLPSEGIIEALFKNFCPDIFLRLKYIKGLSATSCIFIDKFMSQKVLFTMPSLAQSVCHVFINMIYTDDKDRAKIFLLLKVSSIFLRHY